MTRGGVRNGRLGMEIENSRLVKAVWYVVTQNEEREKMEGRTRFGGPPSVEHDQLRQGGRLRFPYSRSVPFFLGTVESW